ncbi:hypothetical protein GCM10009809_23960 [Isoptericola hypogeus]|uniref:Uncharacterized protein n=1 Tax=Isoptericola hypogeus TaxID=300179 RepID=A0ABN2JHI6_9MICO
MSRVGAAGPGIPARPEGSPGPSGYVVDMPTAYQDSNVCANDLSCNTAECANACRTAQPSVRRGRGSSTRLRTSSTRLRTPEAVMPLGRSCTPGYHGITGVDPAITGEPPEERSGHRSQ